MTKDEVMDVSMSIVAYAGDAFSHYYEAVELARVGKFDESDAQMAAGDASMHEAHDAQFGMISDEADGRDVPVGIICVHGQDHLMTAIMYQRTAKQLIRLYRDLAEKGITFEEEAQ